MGFMNNGRLLSRILGGGQGEAFLRDQLTRDWLIEDARFIAARVDLDPEAAARWLPRNLHPTGTARLFFAYYPKTSFGSVYNEVALSSMRAADGHARRRRRGASNIVRGSSSTTTSL